MVAPMSNTFGVPSICGNACSTIAATSRASSAHSELHRKTRPA